MRITRRTRLTLYALAAYLILVVAVNYGAGPAGATEAHISATPSIPCDATVGTIRMDVWATDHGDDATVTEAWGLDGAVKAYWLDKVIVSDTPAVSHDFPAAPGEYLIGVTLTFESGLISSDQATVVVPPAAVCPTSTVATTVPPPVTTLPAPTVATTVPQVTESSIPNDQPTPDTTPAVTVSATLPRTGADRVTIGSVWMAVAMLLSGCGLAALGRREPTAP